MWLLSANTVMAFNATDRSLGAEDVNWVIKGTILFWRVVSSLTLASCFLVTDLTLRLLFLSFLTFPIVVWGGVGYAGEMSCDAIELDEMREVVVRKHKEI